MFERFVSVPGVIKVRWTSDDPEFHRESRDLAEVQLEGIPSNFGKKDKSSTVQGFFDCLPCDCYIKSIAELREHCSGRQHNRNEVLEKVRKGLIRQLGSSSAKHKEANDDEIQCRGEDLKTVLERAGVPTVGADMVAEVRAHEGGHPLYRCELSDCKEFSGEARVMWRHLQELRHQHHWFVDKYGRAPPLAETREEVEADFRARGYETHKMKRVVSRGMYKMAALRKSVRSEGLTVMPLPDLDGEETEEEEEEEEPRARTRSRSPIARC